MLYSKNYCSNIVDYDIHEYKNGYFIGLIGARSAVRIFVIKSIFLKLTNNMLMFRYKLQYLIYKFYIIKFYKRYRNVCLNLIQKFRSTIWLNSINQSGSFKNILWFKGRSFKISKFNNLFINDGKVKRPRFQLPNNIISILNKKRRFLKLKSDSYIFLRLYLYLIQSVCLPNIYTGKGLRIKGVMIKKKPGKRKIY